MSDLGTARLKLIDVTGRRDFVSGGDVSANVDAGGNAYLLRAQAKLDKRAHYLLPNRRHLAMLRNGVPWIEVGNLLSIETLQLMTSGADRYSISLDRLDYDEFRVSYPEILADQDEGAPAFWAFNPVPMSPDNYTNTRAEDKYDGVLLNEDSHYSSASDALEAADLTQTTTIGTDWAFITSGDVWIEHSAGNTTALVYEENTETAAINTSHMPIIPGRIYQVLFELEGGDAGYFDVSVGGGVAIRVDTSAGAASVSVNCIAGTTTTEYLRIAPSTDSTGAFYTTSATKQLIEITEIVSIPWDKKAILFAPKPNADYTVEIVGKFLSRTLSANDDQSFWTVHYLNALVAQAAVDYYGELGNSARIRHHQEIVNDDLNDGDSALVAEELSGMDMEPLR